VYDVAPLPFIILTLQRCSFIIIIVQVQAYLVRGSGEKAKDPIFGLKMASSSQASDDVFR